VATERTARRAGGSSPIRVVIAGPDGHMGREMVTGLADEPDIVVTGGIRRGDTDPAKALAEADVLLDFTNAQAAPRLILSAIEAGVRPVSGTSGLSEESLEAADAAARKRGIGAIWVPNFSLGAVLMSLMVRLAARHIGSVEIFEGHPARKLDAPSGTALAMARAIRQERGSDFTDPPVRVAHLEGVRGAVEGGVRLHSVRHHAGLVSWHQAILTADDGGVLTIRHDEDMTSAPISAVAKTIRAVTRPDLVGLVRGYESVLGLTV
jgi:4-hydroxy-tetrahydrodipicolinate reductase